MGKYKDKETSEIILLVFSMLMCVFSFAIAFLIAWLFPNFPWKELGRLTLYGIASFGLTIYGILIVFKEFQKRMIGLQVLTGVILFILYYILLAILIKFQILKLPPNTWAYVGVYFIFYPFILYPALRLEYEFFIKRYLKKKNRTKRKDSKGNEEKKKEDVEAEKISKQTQ